MKFNMDELQIKMTLAGMTEYYNKKEQANIKDLKGILERKLGEGAKPEEEAEKLIKALVLTEIDYLMVMAIITGTESELEIEKAHDELTNRINSTYKESLENGSTVMDEIDQLIEALGSTQTDLETLQEIITENLEELDMDIKFKLMLVELANL